LANVYAENRHFQSILHLTRPRKKERQVVREGRTRSERREYNSNKANNPISLASVSYFAAEQPLREEARCKQEISVDKKEVIMFI
jgi:hypothetical protein